jgi:hypothetical protein
MPTRIAVFNSVCCLDSLLYGEFHRHLSSDKGIDGRCTELENKKKETEFPGYPFSCA